MSTQFYINSFSFDEKEPQWDAPWYKCLFKFWVG